MTTWGVALSAVSLVAVLLLAVIAVALIRRRGADRTAILLALLASIAWSLAWFGLLGSQRLPVWLLNPNQEGLLGAIVKSIYGSNYHIGDLFRWLVKAYALLDGGAPQSLRTVVAMNCWLGGVNAILFFATAWRILAHFWGALLFVIAYCASTIFLQSALSDGPGQWLAFDFFCGVLCVRAMHVFASQRFRWWAWIGLVVVLAMAVATRVECAVFACICGMAGLLWIAVPEQQLRAHSLRILTRLRATFFVRQFSRTPLPVAFAIGVGIYALDSELESVDLGLAAILPVDVHVFYLPIGMARVMSPAIVFLFAFGVWYGLRQWRELLLLPLPTLLLMKTYYAAAHNGSTTEMTRYLTLLVPVIFVIALFGWRQLAAVTDRLRWGPSWRVVACVVLGLLAMPELSLANLMVASPAESTPASKLRRILNLGNQQAEVQFLVELMDERPDCVIAAQAVAQDNVSGERWSQSERTRVLLFGGPLGGWEEHPLTGDVVAVAKAAVRNRATCVLAYEGLDCALALTGGPKCTLAGHHLKVAKTVRVDDPGFYCHVVFPSPVQLTAYELP